jgi:hypothetical protein
MDCQSEELMNDRREGAGGRRGAGGGCDDAVKGEVEKERDAGSAGDEEKEEPEEGEEEEEGEKDDDCVIVADLGNVPCPPLPERREDMRREKEVDSEGR